MDNKDIEYYTVSTSVQPPSQSIPLQRFLFLDPRPVVLVSRPYGEVKTIPKTTIRPPSTQGWYERMVYGEGTQRAMYVVQNILKTRQQLWLTIFEQETGRVLEAHTIRREEVEALRMPTSWTLTDYAKILHLWHEDCVRRLGSIDFDLLLSGPPPAWHDIAELTEGVDIQHKNTDTMYEVLSRLIPGDFPQTVRDEIVRALAWLIRNRTTKMDPFDLAGLFVNDEIGRTMIEYQYTRYPDGKRLAPFARMMADAVRISRMKEAAIETTESRRQVHHVFMKEMLDYTPPEFTRLLDMATRLSREQELIRGLPVSREDTFADCDSWMMRLMMARHGLLLNGSINYPAIGLTEAIYMGHVNPWPHKYLHWIASIGDSEERTPLSIQVNVVPNHLQDCLLQTRPSHPIDRRGWGWFITDWYAYVENNSRYSVKRGWLTNIDNIIISVEDEIDPIKFKREYNRWKSVPQVQELTASEIWTLDYVCAVGLYPFMIEIPGAESVLNRDWNTLFEEIESLRERGILDYWYTLRHRGLETVVTLVYGQPERVTALSRALLRETPTSSLRMHRDCQSSIVISRMSPLCARTLMETLPGLSSTSLTISCGPMTSWRLYANNLLQRIHQ